MDIQTVTKVARLSRIRLTEAEKPVYAERLSGILQWVEQLSAVSTDGVPQLTSVSDVSLPWRADKVTDGSQQEAVLANAPSADYGCFAVPKVIE